MSNEAEFYKNQKKILDDYQFVSFDIYDTLVFRSYKDANCLYEDIEKIAIRKSSVFKGFARKRVNAEIMARKDNYPFDVSLNYIYTFLDYTEEEKDYVQVIEKNLEINCTIPNKVMIDFLNKCIELNKKVIIITDMFLDRGTLAAILNKNGVSFYKMYISSENGYTKRIGTLFQYVLHDLNIRPNQLVHYGDDIINDIVMAKKSGVLGIERYKKNFNTSARLYGYQGSICSDFFSRYYDQYDFEEDIFRVAFMLLGPFLKEYCKWINRKAIDNSIDVIVFVSREGYLIKKVYDQMYPDKRIETKYIDLNKNILRFPSIKENTFIEDFLSSIPQKKRYTWEDICVYLRPKSDLIKTYLKDRGIQLQETLSLDDLKSDKFKDVFNGIYLQICNEILVQKDLLLGYLKENNLTTNKRIALVNNSSNGNAQMQLSKILHEWNFDIELFGFQFIKTTQAKRKLNNNVFSWFSDSNISSLNMYIFWKNSLLFEHLLFEPVGTALYFSRQKSGILVVHDKRRKEILNDTLISKIQEGVLCYLDISNDMDTFHDSRTVINCFCRFLSFPLRKDAELFARIYDDDVERDTSIIDLNIKMKINYLISLSIPEGIVWLPGYLSVKSFSWAHHIVYGTEYLRFYLKNNNKF